MGVVLWRGVVYNDPTHSSYSSKGEVRKWDPRFMKPVSGFTALPETNVCAVHTTADLLSWWVTTHTLREGVWLIYYYCPPPPLAVPPIKLLNSTVWTRVNLLIVSVTMTVLWVNELDQPNRSHSIPTRWVCEWVWFVLLIVINSYGWLPEELMG